MGKALDTIIVAAVLPALAFFYGFAFRLAVFDTVGIPLQWLSRTYVENAGIGSPLLFEVSKAILFASVIFFIVEFVLNRVSALSPFLKKRINSGLISLLVSFLAFLTKAYHFNHAPCGEFIVWMVAFGFLVDAGWQLQNESRQTIFLTIVFLSYFGWYGIDQAVYFGKASACNNKRTTLTIDSREYVYFDNFGEFFILREMAESKYWLIAFPSKDAQRGGYVFQTKEVALPECPVEKQEFPCSLFSWLRKGLCNSTE